MVHFYNQGKREGGGKRTLVDACCQRGGKSSAVLAFYPMGRKERWVRTEKTEVDSVIAQKKKGREGTRIRPPRRNKRGPSSS